MSVVVTLPAFTVSLIHIFNHILPVFFVLIACGAGLVAYDFVRYKLGQDPWRWCVPSHGLNGWKLLIWLETALVYALVGTGVLEVLLLLGIIISALFPQIET